MQGGLRYGGEHLFWGPTGSGKTMAAYQTLALAQKQGKSCALVDSEGAFTVKWGQELGIDTDKLLIITDKNMARVTNKCKELLDKGIDFLLIDSISTLLPPAYFDKDGELKEMGDTNAIANHAKGCVTMLNILNGANKGNTLVLFLSQQTTNITPVGAIQMPHGGNKFRHNMTSIVKFGSNLAEKHRLTGDVTEGDHIFTKVTGRPVNWFIEKERGPGMHSKGTYDIYFAGEFVGIDNVSEMVDYGVEYGVIKKRGAWFDIYEDSLQGRPKAIAHVRANQAVRDTLEGDLLAATA